MEYFLDDLTIHIYTPISPTRQQPIKKHRFQQYSGLHRCWLPVVNLYCLQACGYSYYKHFRFISLRINLKNKFLIDSSTTYLFTTWHLILIKLIPLAQNKIINYKFSLKNINNKNMLYKENIKRCNQPINHKHIYAR